MLRFDKETMEFLKDENREAFLVIELSGKIPKYYGCRRSIPEHGEKREGTSKQVGPRTFSLLRATGTWRKYCNR